jgi:HEAT repeat protein
VNQVEVFIRDLKSPDQAVREASARSLSQLGAGAKPAVTALIDALLAESSACPSIGTAICRLGPSRDDLDVLRAALRHPNSHVRFWGARALVTLGPVAEPAIPELIPLLTDAQTTVVDSVIWALGAIGDASLDPLNAVATTADEALRRMALIALGSYADHIASKLQTVVNALDDCSPGIRRAAAWAVCSLAQRLRERKRNAKLSADEQDALPILRRAIMRIETDPEIDQAPDWTSRIAAWLDAELS